MRSGLRDTRSQQSEDAVPVHARRDWRVSRLADVADFRLGKMLDRAKNKGYPRPYLANLNVRWGRFDLHDLREMRFEEHEIEKYGLRHGDIVMCEGGEPGRCAIWKEQLPGMTIQKALHRIRPDACMSNEFMYYNLFYRGRAGRFAPLFTGATIKHLPRQQLAMVEVDVPPMAVQERIADVLSAYDDLIENNRRRITLLEQAARELYREWFVRLRFPGHESTRIVDGVPEGWERVRLSDLVSTQYGYTASASEEAIGPKFLRGTDINKNSYIDWDTVPYCPVNNLNVGKYALRPGDLLVVRMADPGKVAIVEKDIQAVFASYLVRMVIHDHSRTPSLYLFYVLADSEYQGFIGAASGGSTRKSASAKLLTDFRVIQPPGVVQSLFVDHVAPLREMMGTLLDQNAQARASRDILVPRLMSGELAV